MISWLYTCICEVINITNQISVRKYVYSIIEKFCHSTRRCFDNWICCFEFFISLPSSWEYMWAKHYSLCAPHWKFSEDDPYMSMQQAKRPVYIYWRIPYRRLARRHYLLPFLNTAALPVLKGCPSVPKNVVLGCRWSLLTGLWLTCSVSSDLSVYCVVLQDRYR